MKVLHIDSERDWRGGQQQAAYLIERMKHSGLDTALICKPGSSFHSYCLKNEITCYPMAMHGEIDVFAGFRIAQICKKKGYTIAHLHSAHALAIGLWAKLFFRKLRLVAVRRVDFHIKKNRFSQFKYKTNLLDKIVCISDGIKRVLLGDGIPEAKLVTIHSGVDLNKFVDIQPPDDFRQSLNIPKDHVLVGTVAAISGHKDYPNLLHAAKKIIEKTDKVSFCAVGDGPDQEAVYALKERLGLGDRFVFTGFRTDVGQFLKSFDIFVLSSYLEGLGTSILDAQALGLPVVACDTGGIPEAVYDRVNGLLVQPRDSEALSQAILELVGNENLRREYGIMGLETVKAFSIETTVAKNIALYRRLLSDQDESLIEEA